MLGMQIEPGRTIKVAGQAAMIRAKERFMKRFTIAISAFTVCLALAATAHAQKAAGGAAGVPGAGPASGNGVYGVMGAGPAAGNGSMGVPGAGPASGPGPAGVPGAGPGQVQANSM